MTLGVYVSAGAEELWGSNVGGCYTRMYTGIVLQHCSSVVWYPRPLEPREDRGKLAAMHTVPSHYQLRQKLQQPSSIFSTFFPRHGRIMMAFRCPISCNHTGNSAATVPYQNSQVVSTPCQSFRWKSKCCTYRYVVAPNISM